MDTPLLGTTPGNGTEGMATITGSIQPLTIESKTSYYHTQGVAHGLWPTHKGLCLALLLVVATLGGLVGGLIVALTQSGYATYTSFYAPSKKS
jgi:hypothetical protein